MRAASLVLQACALPFTLLFLAAWFRDLPRQPHWTWLEYCCAITATLWIAGFALAAVAP